MRAYTVHAPPDELEPERFAFVKDGFSWPAFLIPVLWILWHRMWLALLGYVVFLLALLWVAAFGGEGYATLLAVAVALLLGLEGNSIRRLSLESRGWREVGESSGRNLEEAEMRFFGSWASLPPHKREELLAGAAHAAGGSFAASDEPILGLFPEPDR